MPMAKEVAQACPSRQMLSLTRTAPTPPIPPKIPVHQASGLLPRLWLLSGVHFSPHHSSPWFPYTLGLKCHFQKWAPTSCPLTTAVQQETCFPHTFTKIGNSYLLFSSVSLALRMFLCTQQMLDEYLLGEGKNDKVAEPGIKPRSVGLYLFHLHPVVLVRQGVFTWPQDPTNPSPHPSLSCAQHREVTLLGP